eukprot:TRINITY_DN49521_c0_g1_i1.p1 TRINITY_DN49521_c0_g1~~TRINITY_DN49521_c0_g1_i1.p1  ORF type:complete len:377 (-),score=58.09 TRINITY_DN49521_c0_g1_i1:38-1033(-)
MVVPAKMPSRLEKAWCAICNEVVCAEPRKLRTHERRAHQQSSSFQCSGCERSFSCSDDLRKHSRSKQHAIPAAFGRHLQSSLAQDASDHEQDSEAMPRRAHVKSETSSSASGHPNQAPAEVEQPSFVVTGASAERGEKSTRCALCQHECSAKELSSHEEKQHKQTDFECQSCRATFSCSKNLRKHSRSTSHKIPCIFMLDGERDVLIGAAGTEASLQFPDGDDAGLLPEMASPSTYEQDAGGYGSKGATSEEPLTLWSNTRAGIRLMERTGTTSAASNSSGSSPLWGDLVLERYQNDAGRMYLYCPATRGMFWEDEANGQGWEREVWRRDL